MKIAIALLALWSSPIVCCAQDRVIQESKGACSPNVVGTQNSVLCQTYIESNPKKLDEALDLIRSEQIAHKYQEQYPLGYTVFELNSVTEAVTPIDAKTKLGKYGFDFHAVHAEMSGRQIKIQLPDVTFDGKPLGMKPSIGGDIDYMIRYGAGLFFDNDGMMISALGQVLQYNGGKMIWIFGLREIGPTSRFKANHPSER